MRDCRPLKTSARIIIRDKRAGLSAVATVASNQSATATKKLQRLTIWFRKL
jgi:hypothetical protein